MSTTHGTTARHDDGAERGALSLDAHTFGWLLDVEPDTLRMLHDARRTALTDGLRSVPMMSPRLEYGYAVTLHGQTGSTARPDDGWTALDDDDATAAITETWSHVYGDEWHDDGTLSVWCVARLVTGSAEWIGSTHYGVATGEPTDYRTLRSMARDDAESAARDYRSACRASLAVIAASVEMRRHDGDAERATYRHDARGAGWIDAETYGALRRAVMRWTFGNARTTHDGASARAHVRAGVTANGMPVDVHAIDDATQNGALIIQRWMTRGMPESMDALTADMDAESAARVVVATAARDGLRMTTRHKSPTALATERAAWTRSRDSHAWTTARAAEYGDRSTPYAPRATAERHDVPGYVHGSTDGIRTDALLARLTARDAHGALMAPHCLRLMLHDGNVADAVVSMRPDAVKPNGEPKTAARDAFLRACRAEWRALTEYDGTTYDDAREFLDGLTFAR